MDPAKREILRRVRVFADLGDEDCDAVLAVLKARRGAPGDVLFREGDRGDSLMIVLDGALVATVRTSQGTDEEVARLGPGEVVGEMAFVDAEPRSATISAPNGATILDFSRAALSHLRKTSPKVAARIQRNVLVDVARRLRDAGEKLSDAAFASGPSSLRGGAPSGADARGRGRGLTVEQLRGIPALASYTPEDLELLDGWPQATTGRAPPPVQGFVGAMTTPEVSSGAPVRSVEWYITRQATVPYGADCSCSVRTMSPGLPAGIGSGSA